VFPRTTARISGPKGTSTFRAKLNGKLACGRNTQKAYRRAGAASIPCRVASFSEMTADGPRADWVHKHYKQTIVVRSLLAPWILFVTVFLCVKGYWWGLVFLPFLALDLWLLRSLVRYARTQGRS